MKALAVDANILISLFLGKKLKQLVIDNLENLKNIEIKDWPTLALALKLAVLCGLTTKTSLVLVYLCGAARRLGII